MLTLTTLTVALAACGSPSKDDVRERAFLSKYEAATSAGRFCDAADIAADRFEYIPDQDEDRETIAKRGLAWIQRTETSRAACTKQQWPAREAQLKAEIKKRLDEKARYDDLGKVSAMVVAGSWREDSGGMRCLIDITVNNASRQAIKGFTFNGKPDNLISMTGTVGPLDSPIAPGETRRVTTCIDQPSQAYDLAEGNNLPARPLYITDLTTADGQTASLMQWRRGDPDFQFQAQVDELNRTIEAEKPHP